MDQDRLVIPCEITGEMLREHALFDIFYRRKRWKNPAIFAAILVAFSVVCFIVGALRGQGALLGWVLLIIGVGLPAIYIGSFLSRLNAQTRALTQKKFTLKFTVWLEKEKENGKDGVTIIKGDKKESYHWDMFVHAYRLRQVICLYPNEQQALLIPSKNGEDAAWDLICSALSLEKAIDTRKITKN